MMRSSARKALEVSVERTGDRAEHPDDSRNSAKDQEDRED